MNRGIGLILITIFALSARVGADTLYMKSGTTIEGRIVRETDTNITFQIGSTTTIVNKDLIARYEKHDEAGATPTATPAAATPIATPALPQKEVKWTIETVVTTDCAEARVIAMALSTIGYQNVYTVHEPPLYKTRVGTYTSKEEAERIKGQIETQLKDSCSLIEESRPAQEIRRLTDLTAKQATITDSDDENSAPAAPPRETTATRPTTTKSKSAIKIAPRPTGEKTVYVKGYQRKDGTYVKPYYRRPPKR
jgi:hypothetical protein